MTLQQSSTETPKPQTWNTSELGPRQRKTFMDALGRFNWEARTGGELTDYGNGKPNYFTVLFGPWVNPDAPALLEAIKGGTLGCIITPKMLRRVIAEIDAAVAKMALNRPVVDRRKKVSNG